MLAGTGGAMGVWVGWGALALFVREFKDEVRGPGSPGWVQRASLAPLAFIAKRRGRAERYAPARPALA